MQGIEAMGDVTASSEASREPVNGLLFDSRVQGALLADGFNGLFSALMTNSEPLADLPENR